MAIEWSPDYCLVCDRQTLGGPYCSQACRLAELDPVPLDPGSPSHLDHYTHIINRSSTIKSLSHTTTVSSFGNTARSYGTRSSTGSIEKSSTNLSPSPSRSSISSLRSNVSQSETVAGHARNELRDYASCFDQVRDLKRRMTTS